MRIAVFVLAGIQFAILIAFGISVAGLNDAAQARLSGFITLGGIIMAVLLAPALILAINRRGLGVALTLSILSLGILTLGLARF